MRGEAKEWNDMKQEVEEAGNEGAGSERGEAQSR